MRFCKFLKHTIVFLLTFLFGVQTTHAKTELVLPQKQVVFSVEQSQSFQSLEKEVQPNVGFLKEKSKFVAVQRSSDVKPYSFSKLTYGLLVNAGGSFTKLSTKSSLSTSLFNSLDNALVSAPSIKFNYGSKTLQSPKQFLNATGNDMYDIVFSNGGYAKFDKATGRMLYSDGTNQYFIRYTAGNNVADVEQLINSRVTKLRNCLGLNGNQTIQLTNGLGSVTTNPNKVTTFIGKTDETQLLKNQFGDFKHIEVGETPGGVNLLNMPDPYFNGATWFSDYNQGWILRALNRGDDIYIVSPINNSTLYNDYGGSYFAKELNELVSAGIKPKNIDLATWNSLKTDIIIASGTKY